VAGAVAATEVVVEVMAAVAVAIEAIEAGAVVMVVAAAMAEVEVATSNQWSQGALFANDMTRGRCLAG
jgi:hypothetical protein